MAELESERNGHIGRWCPPLIHEPETEPMRDLPADHGGGRGEGITAMEPTEGFEPSTA